MLHAPPEACFDSPWYRSTAGKPKPARQHPGRRPAGELEQRERVAVRLGEYPFAHASVHGGGNDRPQQFARGGIRQAAQSQLGQPSQLLKPAQLALSEQELDELGVHLEQAKRLATTRPHTNVPPTPEVLKVAAPIAGATDRIRDVLAGRKGR